MPKFIHSFIKINTIEESPRIVDPKWNKIKNSKSTCSTTATITTQEWPTKNKKKLMSVPNLEQLTSRYH